MSVGEGGLGARDDECDGGGDRARLPRPWRLSRSSRRLLLLYVSLLEPLRLLLRREDDDGGGGDAADRRLRRWRLRLRLRPPESLDEDELDLDEALLLRLLRLSDASLDP